SLPVEIERTPAAKVSDKGHDWRAEVGARSNSGRSIDLARAREPGCGREANTPEQIPPRGWRDILWRVLWSISADRILSTSGGVAFFALLAVFPGIAAIVSLSRPSAGPFRIRRSALTMPVLTFLVRRGQEMLQLGEVIGPLGHLPRR